MEGNMHIRCPKDVDMNLFTRLFSSLVTGDDLDDLIFLSLIHISEPTRH